MRLSWQDAGISMSDGAKRILRRKQRLTCDAAEAAIMGVSTPVEIDPTLIAMLQELLAKGLINEDGIADALWSHMNHDEQPPEDLQAQAAKQQVERQNNRDGLTTTGGGNNLEPSSRAGESGGYLPNQAGTVSSESVNGTTAKSLDPGTVFDAKTMRQHWNNVRLATNGLRADIERRNQKFWQRKVN